MTEYLHLSLPKKVLEAIDAKARHDYLTRSAVARQYLMRALLDEAVSNMRKKGYSIRKIAEELDIATIRVYEALKRTGVDEELYAEDNLP